jgi:tight adherence protein C
MNDIMITLIPALSFGAVAGLIFVLGHYYSSQLRIQQRLPVRTASGFDAADAPLPGIYGFVVRHFNERRLGYNDALREKLRLGLLKAGYFSRHAVNYYVFAKVACAIGFPLLFFGLTRFFSTAVPPLLAVMVTVIALLIGFAAPDAFVSRRQGALARRYQHAFPDLLDLLVICTDAGMTMDGAFKRVQGEIMKRCDELGRSIELMNAEVRAGRNAIDALESFAERLMLDEAGAFVTLVRQSIELGSDTAEALRIFSDEMREKRLMRAEEIANKLSVKMVLPLGLFIFPVVLLVIMLPVIIKLSAVLR